VKKNGAKGGPYYGLWSESAGGAKPPWRLAGEYAPLERCAAPPPQHALSVDESTGPEGGSGKDRLDTGEGDTHTYTHTHKHTLDTGETHTRISGRGRDRCVSVRALVGASVCA
jgi:hypothetical protein